MMLSAPPQGTLAFHASCRSQGCGTSTSAAGAQAPRLSYGASCSSHTARCNPVPRDSVRPQLLSLRSWRCQSPREVAARSAPVSDIQVITGVPGNQHVDLTVLRDIEVGLSLLNPCNVVF